MELLVTPTGSVHCVYDELLDLKALGSLEICRGSHVEPDERGCWTADLAPVNGPVLGPFESRALALAAETAWLGEHWLSRPSTG
jgi:hypothetical protein